MNPSVCYVGLDVSKTSLDFYFQGKIQKVENNSTGHQVLVAWVKKQSSIHIVCEATGGYERRFIRVLMEENIPVSIIQPGRIRQFAKASGILAKTDSIDAKVITHFAEVFKPPAAVIGHSSTLEMSDLCTYRSQLQEKRVQILHQVRCSN